MKVEIMDRGAQDLYEEVDIDDFQEIVLVLSPIFTKLKDSDKTFSSYVDRNRHIKNILKGSRKLKNDMSLIRFHIKQAMDIIAELRDASAVKNINKKDRMATIRW